MNVVNCPSSSALQSLTPVSHIPVCFLDTVVLPGCSRGCWDLAHLEGTVKKEIKIKASSVTKGVGGNNQANSQNRQFSDSIMSTVYVKHFV